MQTDSKHFGNLAPESYMIWALIVQCNNVTKRTALPYFPWEQKKHFEEWFWKELIKKKINLVKLFPQMKIQDNDLLIYINCIFRIRFRLVEVWYKSFEINLASSWASISTA